MASLSDRTALTLRNTSAPACLKQMDVPLSFGYTPMVGDLRIDFASISSSWHRCSNMVLLWSGPGLHRVTTTWPLFVSLQIHGRTWSAGYQYPLAQAKPDNPLRLAMSSLLPFAQQGAVVPFVTQLRDDCDWKAFEAITYPKLNTNHTPKQDDKPLQSQESSFSTCPSTVPTQFACAINHKERDRTTSHSNHCSLPLSRVFVYG